MNVNTHYMCRATSRAEIVSMGHIYIYAYIYIYLHIHYVYTYTYTHAYVDIDFYIYICRYLDIYVVYLPGLLRVRKMALVFICV